MPFKSFGTNQPVMLHGTQQVIQRNSLQHKLSIWVEIYFESRTYNPDTDMAYYIIKSCIRALKQGFTNVYVTGVSPNGY